MVLAALRSSRPPAIHGLRFIKKVYEIDPLACPQCGATMKVVGFIDPPQREVIEKILKHHGLWHQPSERAPPPGNYVEDPEEILETEYIPFDTFIAEF